MSKIANLLELPKIGNFFSVGVAQENHSQHADLWY